MNTTKTYLGKTAGGWLKQAVVGESGAGCPEIFLRDGVQVLRSDCGMVIHAQGGVLAHLELSTRAAAKLDALVEEQNKLGYVLLMA